MTDNRFWDLFLMWSNWDENAGPRPGIFLSKPRGGQCLWSTHWTWLGGEMQPDMLRCVSDLDVIEMVTELSDISALQFKKKPDLSNRAEQIYHQAINDTGSRWNSSALQIIREHRSWENCPIFIFPGCPPASRGFGRLMSVQQKDVRPGWGDINSILQKADTMPPKTTLR